MRLLANVVAIVVVFLVGRSIADASTLLTVDVVDGTHTGYTGIRQLGNTSGVTAGQYWHASGYAVPGDGGGGDFYTGSSLTSCAPVSVNGATWTRNSPVVSFTLAGTVLVGMGLATTTASGLTVYDMVVKVSAASLTLATAPVQNSSTATTLSFSRDNGGSAIADTETPTPHCFSRVSYNYSPKEWGAQLNFKPSGPIGTDDTIALGNWINANQPHIAVPGLSVITAPLICNDGGVIQGPPTQAVAESQAAIPQFTIYAPNIINTIYQFSIALGVTPAMLVMQSQNLTNTGPARCAIHGVGLIADGAGAIDAIHALGTGDLVDGHSYVGNGRYNVSDASTTSNLQIYDSSINDGYSANLYLTSSGAKISRNSIGSAGNGNSNNVGDDIDINFSLPSPIASDILITDNIIQQAQGWGLNANDARFLRVVSNYFDDNGKGNTLPNAGGIEINDTSVATICGNTFHRNASGWQGTSTPTTPPSPYTPHIHFAGTDDSISLCGNVYLQGLTNGLPNNQTPIIAVRPDFDFDADSAAVLTNFSIQDNPAPQNYGVYSPGSTLGLPNAVTLLQSSNIPQVPPNFFSGFSLSYSGGTVVSINPGAAADSTNSVMLKRSSACPVDLTNSGLGGLDTSPAVPVAANTTYYFFIIAAPGGGSVNCMASTSLTPSFANVASYGLTTYAYTTNGSPLVFNATPTSNTPPPTLSSNLKVNPLAGLMPNDSVTGSGSQFTSSTSLASLGPYYYDWMGTIVSAGTIIQFSGSALSGVVPEMMVGGPKIVSNTYVMNVCLTSGCSGTGTNCTSVFGVSPPCVTLSTAALGEPSGVYFYFGGNFNFTVTPNASGSSMNESVTAQGGLYRLVGALYTRPTSTDIVPFSQDGETVYLTTPVQDINSTLSSPICSSPLGSSLVQCGLSVPCGRTVACAQGVKVEAFGRIVGGSNELLITSLDQSGASPSGFINPLVFSGYSTTSSTTSTAHPFRLYTSLAGQVGVQASAGLLPTNAYEVTDGWVFHPSP